MNLSTIDFKFANLDDVPVLAAMNLALIRDEKHRNTMSLPELDERMARWLDRPYRAVLFEHEGGAVGYALYRDEKDHVYLRQFYVKGKHRRKGIGRAALSWLRENAWEAEKTVRLDVLVHNDIGIQFWRAVGFRDYCLTMELGKSSDEDP